MAKNSIKSDVLVLTDCWEGLVLAYFQQEKFSDTKILLLEEVSANRPKVISIGNGEYFAYVKKLMGNELADAIWNLSTHNFSQAESFFTQRKINYQLATTLRYATSENETEWQKQTQNLCEYVSFKAPTPPYTSIQKEPGIKFSTQEVKENLIKYFTQKGCLLKTSGPIAMGAKGFSNYQVKTPQNTFLATSLVVYSREKIHSWFPTLEDKLIPISLSSFQFEPKRSHPDGLHLFNQGADFAVSIDASLWLGSYRNLHQDSGVGIKRVADKKTLEGVSRYFSDRGWIECVAPKEAFIEVETFACDGVPVIGPLAQAPGIYAVGGFMGRSENFVFEVARSLAELMQDQQPRSGLDRFSTKRFL